MLSGLALIAKSIAVTAGSGCNSPALELDESAATCYTVVQHAFLYAQQANQKCFFHLLYNISYLCINGLLEYDSFTFPAELMSGCGLLKLIFHPHCIYHIHTAVSADFLLWPLL
ncbi:hypothetical protein FKM82_014612 [Ascaphus truei]